MQRDCWLDTSARCISSLNPVFILFYYKQHPVKSSGDYNPIDTTHRYFKNHHPKSDKNKYHGHCQKQTAKIITSPMQIKLRENKNIVHVNKIIVSSASAKTPTIISKGDDMGYQVKLHLASMREDKISGEEPKNAIREPE